jgi:hypothetical protein
MPNVLFIILISFFTLCISFVSVKGTLSDLKYKKKWWKIITKRGWGAIVLTLSVIMLLVWQNYLSEKTSDKKDEALKKEKEKSDSTVTNRIKAGVDSNRKILFDDLSQALAKQGLGFDSNQKRIEKLVKDSSKIRVFEKEDPVLHLVTMAGKKGIEIIKEDNGAFTIEIQILSSDAGSGGFEITYSILKANSKDQIIYLGKRSPLQYNKKLSANQASISPFIIPSDNYGKPEMIFVWARGKYKNIDLSKTFQLDEVYYYNVNGNTFGEMEGKTREAILNNVKMNER